MTHITSEQLDAYLLDPVDASDAAAIATHLGTCAECRARLTAEAKLELQLEQVRRDVFCLECERIVVDGACDHCGALRHLRGYALDSIKTRHARGRLYVGRDSSDRKVAIKELVFANAPGLDAVEAFERETRFLVTLDHPSIPKFVDAFTVGEGVRTRMYLIQEFVEGESLLERMAHHQFEAGEIERIARDVLRTLIYLQGLTPMVFHRDVKPANLLRRPDGSIVLVDFGAARDVGATINATLVGTFGYMPVEQLAGIVDATSDLYGLGASLWHLATRTAPWKLDEREQQRAHVPRQLRDFLKRMTATRSEDRFATATAALAALDKPPRRRPSLALVAGVLGVTLAAGGGMALVAKREHRSQNTALTPPAARTFEPQASPGLGGSLPAPPAPATGPLPTPVERLMTTSPSTPRCERGLFDGNPACRVALPVVTYPTDVGGAGLVIGFADGKFEIYARPANPLGSVDRARLTALAVDPVGPHFYATIGSNSIDATYSRVGEVVPVGVNTPLPGHDENSFLYFGLSAPYGGASDGMVGGLPRLGQASGIAFDTKRRRLVISNELPAGTDNIWAYDPQAKTWSQLEPTPFVQALTYSAEEDVLYAYQRGMYGKWGERFLKLDANGTVLATFAVPGLQVNGKGVIRQIAVRGDQLFAFVEWWIPPSSIIEMEAYTIDLRTKQVVAKTKFR